MTRADSVTLRGTLRSPYGPPVGGAIVHLECRGTANTVADSGSTQTDASGGYMFPIRLAPEECVLSATHPQFASIQQRVYLAAQPVVADLTFVTVAAPKLATVRVHARRPRVAPNDWMRPDVGGAEVSVHVPTRFADRGSDLAALAATQPGVTYVPGTSGTAGISVLGLPPSASTVTLNGLTVNAAVLPRDAYGSTRVSTTLFDASRGGFTGAEIAVRTFTGPAVPRRFVRVMSSVPWLGGSSPAASERSTVSDLAVSGLAAGPIRPGRLFYNTSYDLAVTRDRGVSLANANAPVLAALGLPPDTVAAFLRALATAGVAPGSSLGLRTAARGSVLGRVDFVPTANTKWSATVLAHSSNAPGLFTSITTTPSRAGTLNEWGGALQTSAATYVGDALLNEGTLGVTHEAMTLRGTTRAPEGQVLIVDSAGAMDTRPAAAGAVLQFGGNPALPRKEVTTAYEATDQLSWASLDFKHRGKIAADARWTSASMDRIGNQNGTFFYTSLADLAANRPSAFTRVLNAHTASGQSAVGSLSAGDLWVLTNHASLEYGLRLDGNYVPGTWSIVPGVSPFFTGMNAVPRPTLDASPRVGLRWSYGQSSIGFGDFGAERRGSISAGVGRFVGVVTPGLLYRARLYTGGGNAPSTITCVGNAVPTPSWANLSTSTSCSGLSGSDVSFTAPDVVAFASSYRPPSTWRANASWDYVVAPAVRLTVEGIYSTTHGVSSDVDRNFSDVVRFALSNENDRPVYVPSGAIPASGLFTPAASRRIPTFARVIAEQSDMTSDSRQFRLSLETSRWPRKSDVSLSYVLASTTDRGRGFDGSTAGDPLTVDRAPSAFDIRHQITARVSSALATHVEIGLYVRAQSGLPYTPRVAQDINGDGYANDRAFILNPATSTDSIEANGLRALLVSAPASVRDCVARQIGRIAGPHSCRAPWSVQSDAKLSLTPGAFGLSDRITLSAEIDNLAAATDQLLHGQRHARGWGATELPQDQLLSVRGFDVAQNRFLYVVNPQFGTAQPNRGGVFTPFQVRVEMRIGLGPSIAAATLGRVLAPDRTSEGLDTATVHSRLMRSLADPVQELLQGASALHLTAVQQARLAQIDSEYRSHADSIWRDVALLLASDDGTHVNSRSMPMDQARFRHARARVVAYRDAALTAAVGLLTRDQWDALPEPIRQDLDVQTLHRIEAGWAS